MDYVGSLYTSNGVTTMVIGVDVWEGDRGPVVTLKCIDGIELGWNEYDECWCDNDEGNTWERIIMEPRTTWELGK